MASEAFMVRRARRNDARWMQQSFSPRDPHRPPNYFEEICLQQAAGLLALFVAETTQQAYAGHVKVLWEAQYAPFREARIPEIQDLFVLPGYRRRGVAMRLLDSAEQAIAARAVADDPAAVAQAGLGVGLYAEYGPAQRLYILRGYVPDGRGACYRQQPIRGGQILPFDNDAVLYMVKRLS